MRFSIFLSSFILMLVILNCKDSTTISGAPEDQELIVNGSFEQEGNPSLVGWKLFYTDTITVKFSQDAAPNSGLYSISLLNEWGPVPELQASVGAAKGTHRYRLSVWSKSPDFIGYPLGAVGVARLYHQTADTVIFRKLLSFSDSLWTEHILLDTVSCSLGDMLIVSLSAGQGQWNWGRVLLDNVSLLKLD
jgi:hypothetical protein